MKLQVKEKVKNEDHIKMFMRKNLTFRWENTPL